MCRTTFTRVRGLFWLQGRQAETQGMQNPINLSITYREGCELSHLSYRVRRSVNISVCQNAMRLIVVLVVVSTALDTPCGRVTGQTLNGVAAF